MGLLKGGVYSNNLFGQVFFHLLILKCALMGWDEWMGIRGVVSSFDRGTPRPATGTLREHRKRRVYPKFARDDVGLVEQRGGAWGLVFRISDWIGEER
jgi:hypothetical protein